MVIGERFVWGHIPRTGGDITSMMFEQCFKMGMINSRDSIADTHKHDHFSLRNVEDREKVLNIRRLPSFVMSWMVMMSGKLRFSDSLCFSGGVFIPDRPVFEKHIGGKFVCLPVPTKEQLLGDLEYDKRFTSVYGPLHSFPDLYLTLFEAETVCKWIRTEYLLNDFKAMIESFGFMEANKIVIPSNTSKKPMNYDHRIEQFFTQKELERLYANNPFWLSVEERLFT